MSMNYIKELYYGERASENKIFIKWRLNMGKAPSDTYVLILPEYGDGLLEIIKATQLKKSYYKRHDLTVVGVAFGYEEALELAASIVSEAYERMGSFDVRHLCLEDRG